MRTTAEHADVTVFLNVGGASGGRALAVISGFCPWALFCCCMARCPLGTTRTSEPVRSTPRVRCVAMRGGGAALSARCIRKSSRRHERAAKRAPPHHTHTHTHTHTPQTLLNASYIVFVRSWKSDVVAVERVQCRSSSSL